MRWIGRSLGELSGGSARRAAAIIVVAHVAPVLVMLAIWAIGLLPVFDDLRWIPAWTAVVVGIGLLLGMFKWFGFWGTPATHDVGHGEDLMDSFGVGIGFGLGWLRWFMQLVLVTVVLIPGMMTWTDVRGWHLFGTDELRELPDRAAAIPIPNDWVLVESEAAGFGVTELVTWPEGREPNGYVEQTFEVPSDYTFDDLKQWVNSPAWADDPDGDSFGAIEIEECDTNGTRCDVRLVPPAGAQPEHFVRARLHEASSDFDETEVEVRLSYQKYTAPDWDVSQETVERAMMIPIPSDWVRSDMSATTTNSGEDFSQYFRVPESTTREDLEAWLTGPQWTSPSTGEPFGAIEEPECREVGPGELDRTYLCSILVVREDEAALPVESMRATLDSDHQVRVTLSRNG